MTVNDDLVCAGCETSVARGARFCPGCGTQFVEEDIEEEVEDEIEQPFGGNVERKRNPWLRRGLAAVAIVAALLVADWFARTREMENLLDAIEVSEVAMEQPRDDVLPVIQRLGRDGWTDEERSELRRFASDAAEWIIDSGDRVASVSVLPWHRENQAARDAYLEHSEAWEEFWRDRAEDVAAFTKQSPPDISATFRIAERRIRAARPLGFGTGRIDEIFEE